MAKNTWDKVIHAAPTIDNRLTQEIWQQFNRTTKPADAAASFDYEPRVYNPSGPFYKKSEPPQAAAKKEPQK